MVTDGDFELLLPGHPAIWAFLRRTAGAELLVAASFSAEVTGVRLPLAPSLAGTRPMPGGADQPDRRPGSRRPTSSSDPGIVVWRRTRA